MSDHWDKLDDALIEAYEGALSWARREDYLHPHLQAYSALSAHLAGFLDGVESENEVEDE